MLYRYFVEKSIRQSFDHVNNHRWDAAVKAVGPHVHQAAGVGIASQKPFFERISGPASCAPTTTGALDQTSAAAFRLAPAFGNISDRIELLRAAAYRQVCDC